MTMADRAIPMARILGPALFGVNAVIAILGTVLVLTASERAATVLGFYLQTGPETAAALASSTLSLLLLSLVGLVICLRVPGQPVGWLMLLGPCFMTFGVLAAGLGLQAADRQPEALSDLAFMAWLANWSWIPFIVAFGLAFFLFPTGRPLGPRWARAFWIVGLALGGGIALVALYPGPLDQARAIQNPFGVEQLRVIGMEAASLPVLISLLAMLALAVGSMVARYRSGPEVERLQLRWVAAAVALLLLAFGALVVRGAVSGVPWDALSDVVLSFALITVALSIGIAILRYRLYAIDVIIRRTLIYGALSASLAACYLGGVVLFQAVLDPLTSQETLPVAAATLVVAGAFRPLRSRLQHAIDRRFYRARYDMALTTTAFSMRMGQEVDLGVIEDQLVGVAANAVRPDRIAVWRRRTGQVERRDAGSH